ncbi:MAG: 23S rRNA (uracil(1939)-C(5))-methyltransferase RlmD [bacterium]
MNCKFNKECGGCNYLELPYKEELKLKKDYVVKLLKKINYTKDIEIIGNDNEYNYRNKAQMAFKLSQTRNLVSGIYQEKTKSIITVEDCAIHADAINIVLKNVNQALNKCKIEPVGKSKKGLVKFVLVRYGFTSKQVMVVLVTNSDMFPGRSNFVKELLKLSPNITTIVQNVNPRDTTIVLGDKERVLYGSGYIVDKLCGLTFKISPKSFYQINPPQTEKLYNTAISMANIKPTQYVVDAYSGIGTIGLTASKFAKRVLCVENNRDAVADAKVNAKMNKITNVDFVAEDSTKFINKLAETKNKVDVLFMDPPRSGSTYHFIKAVAELKIPNVVYVSCDAETLVRDLEHFIKFNYEIKEIKLVDMFSKTKHIECCVKLSFKK